MKFMNSNKKAQQGFTLIELVVVIVILGILAVTAAPKFIDLTSDARFSVMKGVEGSIEGAVSLAQSKAIIDSQLDATGEILIGGTYYALVHGYPAAEAAGTGAGTTTNGLGIISLIDLDSNSDIATSIDTPNAIFQHSDITTDPHTCQLSYANAANSESRPQITEALTGC